MPPKPEPKPKPQPKPNTTKDTKSGGGTKVVNLDDDWLYHSKK